MKKNEFKQLRDSTLENLKSLVSKGKMEAAKIQLEISRGQTKNLHAYLTKRKDIAKIKTLIKEKELK
jgi:ribosomal protein L29